MTIVKLIRIILNNASREAAHSANKMMIFVPLRGKYFEAIRLIEHSTYL